MKRSCYKCGVEVPEEIEKHFIAQDGRILCDKCSEDMQNYIRKELDAIEGLDKFIQHWVGEGKDISQIKWDIDERDLRKKSLEVYCRKNGKDIKDYYKNE